MLLFPFVEDIIVDTVCEKEGQVMRGSLLTTNPYSIPIEVGGLLQLIWLPYIEPAIVYPSASTPPVKPGTAFMKLVINMNVPALGT